MYQYNQIKYINHNTYSTYIKHVHTNTHQLPNKHKLLNTMLHTHSTYSNTQTVTKKHNLRTHITYTQQPTYYTKHTMYITYIMYINVHYTQHIHNTQETSTYTRCTVQITPSTTEIRMKSKTHLPYFSRPKRNHKCRY